MVKRVHLVFKTHLDIGFTDLASATIQRYMDQFIPHAIETACRLTARGGKERLVWTTGSWLIDTYLKKSEGVQRQRLLDAIEQGDITWHAMPFTTHTEIMDTNLCSYGLSLSKSLDKRFNHTTIAAKMTDVPGHTIALVPLLASHGVAFLHLGVNGGSQVPDVPPLFRWRAPGGHEVLVQYDSTYGSRRVFDGLEDVLVIENSADNSGPPTAEDVIEVYRRLSEDFPDAEILASDLSAYAQRILPYADQFPLVEQEIGDTWIHGVGSDPLKVSRFKLLLRLACEWEMQGSLVPHTASYEQFMDALLMIPEHTWGLDFKKYLGDYKNWSVEDLKKARQQDTIGSDAIPPAFQFIEDFAKIEYEHIFPHGQQRRDCRTYSFFESAHREQRSYLDQAVAALPSALQQEYHAHLALMASLGCRSPEGICLSAERPVVIGSSTVQFAPDGSISSLIDSKGHELVGEEGIGVYRYESFSAESYDRWHHTYNRHFESSKNWILADFGKPGMESVDPPAQHRLYAPILGQLTMHSHTDHVEVEACLTASDETPRGAPRRLILRYRFSLEGKLEGIRLDWFDKEATRLPEALWLSLGLKLSGEGLWKMVKLGIPIELGSTVSLGARSIHAVEALQYGQGQIPDLIIRNIDSPLVSLGKRKLLQFDNQPALENGCFHFNLCNNIWGTNFPLWYEDDGCSRIEFLVPDTNIQGEIVLGWS